MPYFQALWDSTADAWYDGGAAGTVPEGGDTPTSVMPLIEDLNYKGEVIGF